MKIFFYLSRKEQVIINDRSLKEKAEFDWNSENENQLSIIRKEQKFLCSPESRNIELHQIPQRNYCKALKIVCSWFYVI